MPYERLQFTEHVIIRLAERGIGRGAVRQVLEEGEVIRRYPDDNPLPSYLVLGWTGADEPLHVVAADDGEARTTVIITAYRPDPSIWSDDFRRKQDDN